MRRLACAAAVLALAAASAAGHKAALAQGVPKLPKPGQTPLRPGPKPSRDPAASPAGVYMLSSDLAAVILRVAHGGGFSMSVFRMDDVSGALSWDPARIEDCKLNVKIGAKSLRTNVAGLADRLTGPEFLDAARFPDATFVSTTIKRTGPTTGEITGDFTLHGVTRPLTLTAELTGAGQGEKGPALGFHGHGVVKRSDFGVGAKSGVIGDEVEIELDVEFARSA
jgi:polyisoprenoid-binding protein YceI